jgi:hypothetical protein
MIFAGNNVLIITKMNKIFNINGITLIVAIISLVWALWSGYLGLKPHSLEFKLVSQVAIQPKETDSISGIQVTVDGVQVESPYLSVLELTNNGRKPIPKSDFEAPLELHTGSGVMVVRAQVTTTNPKDIEAHLEATKDVLTLSPLLLNPDDTITISVLTAGKPPAFTPRARIADISILSLYDDTKNTSNIVETIAFGILTIALYLSNSCVSSSNMKKRNGLLDWKSVQLINATTVGTGAVMLIKFVSCLGTSDTSIIILIVVLLIIITEFLSYLWNRNSNPDSTKTPST